MTNGNLQSDKLVQVPCDIQSSISFWHSHHVSIVLEPVAQLYLEGLLGFDGLIHQFHATVASNLDGSRESEGQFIDARCAFHL